jgi:hypothetical protein
MPGFDNGVVYFEAGIDPRGTPPVVNQMGVDGRLLIGSSASPYVVCNTLTAGAGISITNGSGSITIGSNGGGLSWSVETADLTAAVNHGYGANKAGALAFTLPATSAVGDVVSIVGMINSWNIVQGAGQRIFFGSTATTLGAGGSLASSNAGDCVEIVCLVADTIWYVKSSIGNITVA